MKHWPIPCIVRVGHNVTACLLCEPSSTQGAEGFLTGIVNAVKESGEDFAPSAPRAILLTVLAFFWLKFFWSAYLNARQRKVYRTHEKVPKELKGIIDKNTFQRTRMYCLDRSSFGTVERLVSHVTFTALIWSMGYKFFWELSGDCFSAFEWDKTEIKQSLLYLTFLNVFSTVIGLPFAIYETLVIEEKHGFNKQTAAYFVVDQIIQFIASHVLAFPLVAAMIKIIQVGGNMFFVYLWAFIFITNILTMVVFPELIIPLLDEYKPLPPGELKDEIEKLAASVKFPLYKLLVAEESRKSTHSNAYFFGFSKFKRVVLLDTLLNEEERKKLRSTRDSAMKNLGCSTQEICAILGHEFGHWKFNHIFKNIIIAKVYSFVMLAFFNQVYQNKLLFAAFGFEEEQPILVGLMIILQFVAAPFHTLLNFCMTYLSRKFEFQADEFAVSLGKGEHLKTALIKLTKDNLGYPIYDKLFSSWYHSHPQLLERLDAIEEADKMYQAANKKDCNCPLIQQKK